MHNFQDLGLGCRKSSVTVSHSDVPTEEVRGTNVDDSIVFFHGTEHFQPTQPPFAALTYEDRRGPDIAMNRMSFFIHKSQGILPQSQ